MKLSIRTAIRTLTVLLGERASLRLFYIFNREFSKTIKVEDIIFDVPDYIPFHRATTIITKEPDTICWIDDIFTENNVFYDIGANIGVFSLYAAKNKRSRVISFEPFAENYAILNRNIFLNGYFDRITALNLAIHDRTVLSKLNVSELWAGKAGHSFDEPIGSVGDVYKPRHLQGVIGMSLDDFINSFELPFPNHIKIDVDGNEPHVVNGMKETLSDDRLTSVAIEINNELDNHLEALERIKAANFKILEDDKYINHAYLSVTTTQNYFLVRY
ncbi:MAG: FkbM family methyltransferase [Pseudomonadota bacterium]|nr:FkbM family methyltransferase [Pseudomonadota bacterium]